MKVEGRRKGEGVSISCSHSFNRMAVSIGKAAIKDAQYTAKVGGNCPHECIIQARFHKNTFDNENDFSRSAWPW